MYITTSAEGCGLDSMADPIKNLIPMGYSVEHDAALAVSEHLRRDVGELLHERRPARRELIHRCRII